MGWLQLLLNHTKFVTRVLFLLPILLPYPAKYDAPTYACQILPHDPLVERVEPKVAKVEEGPKTPVVFELGHQVVAKLVADVVLDGLVFFQSPHSPLHREENCVVAEPPKTLVGNHFEEHVLKLLFDWVEGADGDGLEHAPPAVYESCGKHAKGSKLGSPHDINGDTLGLGGRRRTRTRTASALVEQDGLLGHLCSNVSRGEDEGRCY